MTISEKIYKMRVDLGLSQKEFAEKVGTSQSAINFWENGKRQPRMSQIKKIASAFKLPLYALTDDDFEIWDVSNEIENNRARFIDPSNPTKKPTKPFTTASNNERQQNSNDLNLNILMQKLNQNYALTSDEITFLKNQAIKRLGSELEKYYSQLNTVGQQKADEQIDRLLEQLELLTKIPEYRKNPDDTE